jgi:hypothetical protein
LLPQKGKWEKKTYDDLFNSIFDEIEKHPARRGTTGLG